MFDIYCTRCGRAQETYTEWRCACGGPFEIHNGMPFERKDIVQHDYSIWRYQKFLHPLKTTSIVTLGEGMTPLVPLAASQPNVQAKLEYVSPTGSLKDRGVTVMVSHMKEQGVKKALEDSSGNAGASVAAYCARAGIKCEIFVPETVRTGKATQIVTYGAQLRKIPGSRVATTAAARKAAAHTFYASHHWNPFYLHGKETMAYEIAEQMNWHAPDFVFIPFGSGSTFYGTLKGFTNLVESDTIDSYPKLVGVQSAQCAPIYSALTGQFREIAEPITTVADGISIKAPVRQEDVIKAMKAVGAEMEVVSDPEIITSLKTLGQKGIFVEPTSAVVHAAWHKQRDAGTIDEDSQVVLVLTGIGLKATTTITSLFPELGHASHSKLY